MEEVNGQALHLCWLQGKVPLGCGALLGEGRVDQGVPEGTVPAEGGQGREGKCVSGGGIFLEVVEMVSDDLLDVDAGGIVGEDKGNPIAVAGGKRRGEGGSAGDGLDPVEGPVGNSAGGSSVEEEGGRYRGSLVEVGLIRTYAMEMEELREWDGVFTGSRTLEANEEMLTSSLLEDDMPEGMFDMPEETEAEDDALSTG
eukprot:g43923.t1